MTTSFSQDDAHDPETGKYIKPEDRVKAAADQFTITTEEDSPVYNVPPETEYNPDLDPRVHPELTTNYTYTGEENITVGIDTSANVIITEDINLDYSVDTTGFGNTAYDDPAYYASAVDYNVDTMGTTYTVPTTSCECDLTEVLAKLDDLNRKVDHLLEHAHQPLYGTVNLEPPAKVGAGYTV